MQGKDIEHDQTPLALHTFYLPFWWELEAMTRSYASNLSKFSEGQIRMIAFTYV